MNDTARPGRYAWVLNIVLPAIGLLLGYALILGYQAYRQPAAELLVIERDNAQLLRNLGGPAEPLRPVLLSRDDCPYCRQAKAYLGRKGIAVTLIEAPADGRVDELLRTVGTSGVPTLLLGDRVVEGFEEGAWEGILGP